MFVSPVSGLQAHPTTPGFLYGIWAVNSGYMPVWQAPYQLGSPSLLLKHTLIMIHEVCLVFKYNHGNKHI